MQVNRTKLNPTIGGAIKTIKKDIADITGSGNFYITEEIARELWAINNALEHIKLDETLLATSPEWRGKFEAGSLANSESKTVHVLDKMAAYLYDYKNKFHISGLENKQENEVRELHQWAMNNLIDLQGELDNHSLGAAEHIRLFDDHTGVTDRYTGYRNNLTRGSHEPIKIESYWMDKNQKPGLYLRDLPRSYTAIGSGAEVWKKPDVEGMHNSFGVFYSNEHPPGREFKGYRTIDSLYPRATARFYDRLPAPSKTFEDVKLLNSINARTARESITRYQSTPENTILKSTSRVLPSVQEQAGINTTYPERTEYMIRYCQPKEELRTSNFIINPQPNFFIHGRPLAQSSFDPTFTEYQSRYEWPDGNKIVKLPWLRQ